MTISGGGDVGLLGPSPRSSGRLSGGGRGAGMVSGLGATSAAQSFDLSTRCDTAAYALILTGTGAREDRYDPMVFGVAGAEEECVLPSSPTAAGASSKVAPPNTFQP